MNKTRKHQPITITPENRPKPNQPAHKTYEQRMIDLTIKEAEMKDERDRLEILYLFRREFNDLKINEDDYKYFLKLIPLLVEKIELIRNTKKWSYIEREKEIRLKEETLILAVRKLQQFKPIYDRLKPKGIDEIKLLVNYAIDDDIKVKVKDDQRLNYIEFFDLLSQIIGQEHYIKLHETFMEESPY